MTGPSGAAAQIRFVADAGRSFTDFGAYRRKQLPSLHEQPLVGSDLLRDDRPRLGPAASGSVPPETGQQGSDPRALLARNLQSRCSIKLVLTDEAFGLSQAERRDTRLCSGARTVPSPLVWPHPRQGRGAAHDYALLASLRGRPVTARAVRVTSPASSWPRLAGSACSRRDQSWWSSGSWRAGPS